MSTKTTRTETQDPNGGFANSHSYKDDNGNKATITQGIAGADGRPAISPVSNPTVQLSCDGKNIQAPAEKVRELVAEINGAWRMGTNMRLQDNGVREAEFPSGPATTPAGRACAKVGHTPN